MLYDTMSPGFLPALTVLAVVAALFTLAGVREATLGEKTLPGRVRSVSLFGTAGAVTVLFAGITAPTAYHRSLATGVAMVCFAAALVAGLMSYGMKRGNKGEKFDGAISFRSLLDLVEEFILIVDNEGQVVVKNDPPWVRTVFRSPVQTLEQFAETLGNPQLATAAAGEYSARMDEQYFIVTVGKINDSKGFRVGTVVLLHEYTQEQAVINELEEKKRQLKVLNAQLSEEMDVDEELPAFLAGEKFMRSVQSELEEKMNRTLEDVDALLTQPEVSTEQKTKSLRQLAEQLRAVLADIRCIVYEKPR